MYDAAGSLVRIVIGAGLGALIAWLAGFTLEVWAVGGGIAGIIIGGFVGATASLRK